MIDVSAEENAAERPHQETGSKRHESQHQLRKIASSWEKHFADGAGVIAKDEKIVHLQKIAAGDPDDRPDLLFSLFRTELSHCMSSRCTRPRWPVASLTVHGCTIRQTRTVLAAFAYPCFGRG